MHSKDVNILYNIKSYFKNIGNINIRKDRKICVYRVTKLEDLYNIILIHFTKYPLLTSKYSDFILWSKVVNKMLLKKHLNKKGFLYILRIYASINRGVSKQVNNLYSNIIPYGKIKTILPNKLDPYWVSGFIAGEGSFVIGIRKNRIPSKNLIFYFNFTITQHSKDFELMKLFISFFGCGNIKIRSSNKSSRCDYYVQDINSIVNKIIPHFEKYSLESIKKLDYLDFKLVMNMIWKKEHLNTKGQDIISNIIKRMNNKRC